LVEALMERSEHSIQLASVVLPHLIPERDQVVGSPNVPDISADKLDGGVGHLAGFGYEVHGLVLPYIGLVLPYI